MAQFIPVTPDFSVAPQVEAPDFAAAAAAGFKTVICNRPDGEQPGQLTLAAARDLAAAAGLGFVEIPITMPPQPQAVSAFGQALAETTGPVLAYCRTGTRSISLWALSQVGAGALDVEGALAAAARAGYDLGALRPLLERFAAR